LWTIVSSGGVLAALTAVVLFVPTGFVAREPGLTLDLTDPDAPVIRVAGTDTAASGQILATSMTQSDQSVPLTQMVMDFLVPNRDILPADAVLTPGQTAAEAREARRALVLAARDDAVAAGVAQAGYEVAAWPKVLTLRQDGAAAGILQPDDLVVAIDNVPVGTSNAVREQIRQKQVGDQVLVTVLRAGVTEKLTVDKLTASTADRAVPTLGVTLWGTGYTYAPEVTAAIDPDRGDPAQGLALAIATYERLAGTGTPAGTTIAAVGQVTAAGEVTAVSGINQHAMSAWGAHAGLLLIPQASCADLTGTFPGLTIAAVTSLDSAVNALSHYPDAAGRLPTC
jgi:PDZ domain-containing protein